MTAWQAAVASCYFSVKALFPFYQSLKLNNSSQGSMKFPYDVWRK